MMAQNRIDNEITVPPNFIRTIITEDLAKGKVKGD